MSRYAKGQVTPMDLLLVAFVFFIGVGLFMLMNFLSAKDMIISKQTIYMSMEVDDRGSELASLLGASSAGMSHMEVAGDTIAKGYQERISQGLEGLESARSAIGSGFALNLPGTEKTKPAPTTAVQATCIYPDSNTATLEWPILESITITSPPGFRNHPSDGVCKCHAGVDIRGDRLDVVAAANGTVSRVQNLNDGYGKNIMINHDGEWAGYQTLYGHLSTIEVKVGDVVKAGQRIGLSGNTGTSTAPHLHFEVRKSGRAVNPCSYFGIIPAGCSVSDRCTPSVVSEDSYSCEVPIPGAREGELKKKVELVRK